MQYFVFFAKYKHFIYFKSHVTNCREEIISERKDSAGSDIIFSHVLKRN